MKKLLFTLFMVLFALPAYASSTSVLYVGNNSGIANGAEVLGATTGNAPVISALGTDTDVGLIFTTQGNGALNLETAGSGNVILAPGSGNVVIPAFTTSGIVFNNASGVLSSGTALPNGTTATTQSSGDNSTKVATTAYVDAAAGGNAPLNSPALTGTPTAPTAAVGTATTQLATTAFVTPNQNLSANGHYEFAGGLILNWGIYTGGSIATITYDMAFPNHVFGVWVTSAPSQPMGGVSSVGLTTFVLNSETQNPVYWQALGN